MSAQLAGEAKAIQIKEALQNGAAEIERLRQQNGMLALKAQAFETISGLVSLLVPRQNVAYAPDAAWIMRKLLADLEKQEAQGPEPAGEAGPT